MTTRLRTLISGHPLISFTVLSYALSWWPVVAMGVVLPYGPWLAALVVIGCTAGRPGLSCHWHSLHHWRVSPKWYLLAAGVPIIVFLATSSADILLGAKVASTNQLLACAPMLILLQLLVIGGQWEEPGWTGYALPRLQQRLAARPSGSVLATLIVGLIRVSWHMPLLLSGAIPCYDFLLYTPALQFIVSWFYRATQGSVPMVMLLHLMSNVSFALTSPLFLGTDHVRFTWLYIAFAWVIALAGLIRSRTSSRSHSTGT